MLAFGKIVEDSTRLHFPPTLRGLQLAKAAAPTTKCYAKCPCNQKRAFVYQKPEAYKTFFMPTVFRRSRKGAVGAESFAKWGRV